MDDTRGPVAAWLAAVGGVALAAAASALVAVVAMWGPWFRSGSAERNSFGFFRAAQTLGIEWVTPFRIAWFLLPVVLAAATALLLFGARRTGLVVAILLGVVLGVAGALSVAGFGALWGSGAATLAGGCTTVLGCVALLLGARGGRVSR